MYHSGMKRILFICSGVLLLMHLLLFWLLRFVPDYLPVFGTRQINVHGVIVFAAMVGIIWYFLKKYHWEDPEASLGELTSIGLLAELCAEAVFQLIRQYTFPDLSQPVRMFDYFLSVVAGAVIAGIISYYIAGRLKKNGASRFISWLLLIGVVLIYRYLHNLGGL